MEYANVMITIGVLIMGFSALREFFENGFHAERIKKKLAQMSSNFNAEKQKLVKNIATQEAVVKGLKAEVLDLRIEADNLHSQAQQDARVLIGIVNDIVDVNDTFYSKLSVISEYLKGNDENTHKKLALLLQADIESKQKYHEQILAFEKERDERVYRKLLERRSNREEDLEL